MEHDLPKRGAWIYERLSNSFVLIGTVVAEITTFVAGAAGFLRKAGTYAAQQVDRVEAVKRRVDQALAERRKTPSPEEADLQKTIVALKANEEQVASRLRAATQKVIELEQQMSTLTESRSLSRFLAERTASDDYRKHLGLISIIRRDFETLTTRLANPAIGPDGRRVERIILYIDDLDRCPNDKVVDVLQAVHLLLAYPRWLSHALSSTYSAFRDRALLLDEDPDGWQTTPQNYLEKIFQIPFSLRPMTEAGYARLVHGLLSPSNAHAAPASPPREVSGPRTALAAAGGPSDVPIPPAQLNGRFPLPNGETATPPEVPRVTGDGEVGIHKDDLIITSVEARFAERLYSLLPTPRATKRFANIYRILKAPVPPERLRELEGIEQEPGTFQIPMLLLAILIGMPREAAALFPSLYDRIAKGGEPAEVLARLESLGINDKVSAALRQTITEIAAENTFPRSPKTFLYWLPRVSRFSFDVGRTIGATFVTQS
jgi:hypothetical protein